MIFLVVIEKNNNRSEQKLFDMKIRKLKILYRWEWRYREGFGDFFIFLFFFGEQLGLGADSRKEQKIKSMDLSPALEERERGREHKLSYFTLV
jgi:hypothetical protein